MPANATTARARRGLALGAVALSALAVTSACGSSTTGAGGGKTSKENPKQALATGVAALYGGKALTTTLKFDGVGASRLVALSKTSGSPDDVLTSQQAGLISGGSVVTAVTSSGSSFLADKRAGASATAGEKFALTVNSGSAKDLVNVVYTAKTVYARADVKTLAGYSGDSAQVSQLTQPGQIPPQFSFVGDAIAGKWLKLDTGSFAAMLKNQRGASDAPTVGPSQAAALQDAVLGVFAKDVTVTRSSDSASHLVLTGNSRALATDLVGALKQNTAALPGVDQLLARGDNSMVPNKTVTLDAYLTGDTLSSLKLDLEQFLAPADVKAVGSQPLPLELDFGQTADITAPASATAVPSDVLSEFGSGLASSL